MAVSPEIEAEIIRVYRQNNSPFKTAKKVVVSVADVFEVLDKHEAALEAAHERHGGWGREELRPYLVARRKTNSSVWDNAIPEIAAARDNYEVGTHMMATGRDGAYLLLYSIPRKGRADPKPKYFTPEVA